MNRIPLTDENLYDLICKLENTGPMEILEEPLFKQILDDYEFKTKIDLALSQMTGDEHKVKIGEFVAKLMNENKQLKEDNVYLKELNTGLDYACEETEAELDKNKEIVQKVREFNNNHLSSPLYNKLKEIVGDGPEGVKEYNDI